MFYVYTLTGPTGKYVGKTKHPATRWAEHKRASCPKKMRVHRAICKHGIAAFTFEVILTARTNADASACEIAIIAQEKSRGPLYNSTPGGEGVTGPRSRKHKEAIGRGNKRAWAALSSEDRAHRISKMVDAVPLAIRQETARLAREGLTPESNRKISETLQRAWAEMSAEEKHKKTDHLRKIPNWVKREYAMTGTAEERSARARHAAMTGTPEERSARARRAAQKQHAGRTLSQNPEAVRARKRAAAKKAKEREMLQ